MNFWWNTSLGVFKIASQNIVSLGHDHNMLVYARVSNTHLIVLH